MFKNINGKCRNVVQLEQFRMKKNYPQESFEMNDLKLLQAGYVAENFNELLATITHLVKFQEMTKRVVGDEIFKIIESEIDKEE